jgi:hypothetical protein
MFKSNASLSKDAVGTSKLANEATAKAVDGESHQNAANKHFEAQHANEAAGNNTQAQQHKKMGNFHQAKANGQLQNEQHADDLARQADQATKKANLQDYGKDPGEMRSKDEMHQDAADKHQQASDAYKTAGKDRESKYHADMSQAHQEAMGSDSASPGGSSASSSSSASQSSSSSGDHDYSSASGGDNAGTASSE